MTNAPRPHLPEGVLRRLYDEPLAATDAERRHCDECRACQNRLEAIAMTVRETEELLGATHTEVDREQALEVMHARMTGQAHARWWHLRDLLRLRRRAVSMAVAAAVAATCLATTGAAGQLLTVVQPQNIAPVQVAPSALHGLPDLSQFGREEFTGSPSLSAVATAEDAQQQTGLGLHLPAALPSGVSGTPRYLVLSRVTGSFTFDQTAAREWAASHGQPAATIPAGLNHANVQVELGPAVAAIYGADVTRGPGEQRDGPRQLPSLLIAEMHAPRISTSGATLQQIEDFLLAQPSVSPELAARIRAIGDPASTLPIPIPIGPTSGHSVQVAGVGGLAVGDNTGIGTVLLWEKDGTIHVVGGTETEDSLLRFANTL